MFKVKIGEDEYDVDFHHDIPTEADRKSVKVGLMDEHTFRVRFLWLKPYIDYSLMIKRHG